ncbi:MAG: hypothetical protein ACOC32_02765 [Nanoarchaeota archaeon]
MADDFSTLDITRLTPREKILEAVGESVRPGDMCESAPGYIHEGEVEAIAEKLGVSLDELKENFLRQVRAYNTTLHKPKHEANERRVGHKPTDPVHKMPHGKCVFLDKEAKGHKCMLGEAMPFHCRIATDAKHSEKLHAWYLLNHAVKADDPHSVREWAIYLKTHPTIPGGELHELVPDEDARNNILNMHNGGESHGKDDRN